MPKQKKAVQKPVVIEYSEFSHRHHFAPMTTDLVCKDETLILQCLGLPNASVQRVLAVARNSKCSIEQIFDAIQVALDNKTPILSMAGFLISALQNRHAPNIPRIKGLPPIGPKFTPAELRTLDGLIGKWIDGYMLQRGSYRGTQGLFICIGDYACSRKGRFISIDGPTGRRAVLEVMAALYGRILDICKRNGYCRDEFGDKRVYAPPCGLVQMILRVNEKPDIRKLYGMDEIIEVNEHEEGHLIEFFD